MCGFENEHVGSLVAIPDMKVNYLVQLSAVHNPFICPNIIQGSHHPVFGNRPSMLTQEQSTSKHKHALCSLTHSLSDSCGHVAACCLLASTCKSFLFFSKICKLDMQKDMQKLVKPERNR